MPNGYVVLPRSENQARGLARYALDFVAGKFGEIDPRVRERLELFHLDCVACAVAALGCGCDAPRLLREEALSYAGRESHAAYCFASHVPVPAEKAVAANVSAVRELDANGTNFGYNPRTGNSRGEFGHNDFYPVAVAAAQTTGASGAVLLRAMLCLDEIRGRLAEVFSLKTHKIDHVLHGAIASAAVVGAVCGATEEQIESALGLVVAHYVPYRAIRHGHQLSDSKGASAAISSEVAVLSMQRAMRGFRGPADIFRNPQAVFCLCEPPAVEGQSPFDLELATSGHDFAIMGMHFKLGLYEHQSAGAIQGLLDLLASHPELMHDPEQIRRIRISIYEPAFGIIGDPHKRSPSTRQSADHSMVYIVSTLLRKACETQRVGWPDLMLMPADYEPAALFHPVTRSLMNRMEFTHGGPEFDARYPDGIPTLLEIETAAGRRYSSGLVMYPAGHARNTTADLASLLHHKFHRLAALGVPDSASLHARLSNVERLSPEEVRQLYNFPARFA